MFESQIRRNISSSFFLVEGRKTLEQQQQQSLSWRSDRRVRSPLVLLLLFSFDSWLVVCVVVVELFSFFWWPRARPVGPDRPICPAHFVVSVPNICISRRRPTDSSRDSIDARAPSSSFLFFSWGTFASESVNHAHLSTFLLKFYTLRYHLFLFFSFRERERDSPFSLFHYPITAIHLASCNVQLGILSTCRMDCGAILVEPYHGAHSQFNSAISLPLPCRFVPFLSFFFSFFFCWTGKWWNDGRPLYCAAARGNKIQRTRLLREKEIFFLARKALAIYVAHFHILSKGQLARLSLFLFRSFFLSGRFVFSFPLWRCTRSQNFDFLLKLILVFWFFFFKKGYSTGKKKKGKRVPRESHLVNDDDDDDGGPLFLRLVRGKEIGSCLTSLLIESLNISQVPGGLK